MDYLKRKKYILLIGAIGFSTYTAYKLYNSPPIIKTRHHAIKILSALASITEFVGDSAETLGVISKDLKTFIQSDSDEVPGSLKQVFKITKSHEFSESIVTITRAFTMGIISHGYKKDSRFSDRVLEKMFSPEGYGLASVIVESFSRNMVMAIYADRENVTVTNSGDSNWVDVITDEKVRNLIGDCVQQFVTTMVTVYLDKTMDVNTYDEIISSMTNPKQEEQVRNLLGMICNSCVETFVKTSHQVLTNPDSNSNASSLYLIKKGGGNSTIGRVFGHEEMVLSKLTGKVTLATVKSCMGFLFNQLYGGVKSRFVEAYRYFEAKSLIFMTVWISVCLHTLTGPLTLMSV